MKTSVKFSMILASLILPASAEHHEKEHGDKAANKLVGIYEIVSGQRGEEMIPKDRLEGKVRWSEDTIAGYDRDEKRLYVATYTLDTSTDPWTVTMTGTMVPEKENAEAKKFESKGLVKIEGDEVTFIYSTEEGEKPDDFGPEKEDRMFVFRKTEGE